MKKYIVVKHNIMRQQKFYKRHKTADSWSIDPKDAHKYRLRLTAAKIAKRLNAGMSDCWNGIIKYEVEEVEA